MHILCTEAFWEPFAGRLRAAAPGAGWLAMAGDGSVRTVAGPLAGRAAAGAGEAEAATPEVVISSYDLWDEGGPYRPFFSLLAAVPDSLRWHQSCAAGFEAELYGDLLRRGVRLTTGHGTAAPIAEYVLWAVLDTFLGAAGWRAAQGEARWERAGTGHREVAGSSWVVVGVGAIGSEVARRARALGATVTGVRRRPEGDEPVDRMVGPDELLTAVAGADVVVLCAPASRSTHHLADAAFLAAMEPGSVLVNVARGDLVDEHALLAALDAGRPGAAVLDVASEEPLPEDSPLWRHPKVTITPHSSGHTASTNARYLPLVEENLRRYLAGAPLRCERTLADWRA